MPAIQYTVKDHIATIKMNRPERYNAINQDFIDELLDALNHARHDTSVKCIVLTGAGKGFCAGADMSGFNNITAQEVRDYLNTHYTSMIRRIVEMNKPMIAAINGPAAGAGIGLALACDFKVMSETANIRYAFINIGLAPDNGSSWFLAQAVGYSKALEIAVEGEKIPASECLRLGIVSKVYPADQMLEEAYAWAKRLAVRPLIGFAATKRDMRFASQNGLFDTMAYEAEQQMPCLESEDHQEGLQAFLEKREAVFNGK